MNDLNLLLPDSMMKKGVIYPELLELEHEEHDLEYVFTKDPALLNDFLQTREQVFATRDVTCKSLAPNEGWDYGLDSNVLTVLYEGKCVGGAVVIINHGEGEREKFPLEKQGFDLKQHFPQFHLEATPHGVFKSIFAIPQVASWSCSSNILRSVINFSIANNVRYLFASAHPASARRIKVALKKMNIGVEIEICDDIILPYEERWNGVPRQLLYSDFNPLYGEESDVSDKVIAESLYSY